MKQPSIGSVLSNCVLLAGAVLLAPLAGGNEVDQEKSRAHAVFGRGLNTVGAMNHAVFPREIKIKAGGVVDFAVAGFHDIVIFKPGFTIENLVEAGNGQYPSTPPAFVIPPDPNAPLPLPLAFLAEHLYYRGINPAGGPLVTPVSANPSNIFNRSEPVAFFERGTYLVICNLRPHLLDGMYAYVKVD